MSTHLVTNGDSVWVFVFVTVPTGRVVSFVFVVVLGLIERQEQADEIFSLRSFLTQLGVGDGLV